MYPPNKNSVQPFNVGHVPESILLRVRCKPSGFRALIMSNRGTLITVDRGVIGSEKKNFTSPFRAG